MLQSFTPLSPCLTFVLSAFLINIPFGYIRENHPKFSFKWLLWIHASIPLIIYLRISLGIASWFIPVGIFFAVLGQMLGGKWRTKMMSTEEVEGRSQIPKIDLPQGKRINATDLAVVLLNMGGPKTKADVYDFQRRLFADPLLIRFPLAFLLQRFFAWALVTLRAWKAEERYQSIGGGSPIFQSTQNQANALQEELKRRGYTIDVTFAFNYSPPFPEDTMHEIKRKGRKCILLLSLYPHCSRATTGSSTYYLKKAARAIYPDVQFLDAPAYYLHEGYIQAFVDRIAEAIHPGESLDDFYLVFSAHSLPLYFLTQGDPYPFQVAQTVAKVLDRLKRTDRWALVYQSAVGPLQWLKPSTEDMIAALAKRKVNKVLIIPISFVTDHIETLCEIDIEYRQLAERLGITDFRMSKAIECHPGFIQALADSVEGTWVPRENKHDYPYLNV